MGFDEAQIKEFKEIFGFLDQDGNGVIEVDDLVALHGIMGKPADEAALGAMIAEAPGPLDFQMLLQLFGEKMSGTDPEETIMAGWALFDPSASGEMAVDAVKALLCNRGVKADRNTGAKAATKPVGCPSLMMPALLTKISGELSQQQHHKKKNTVCHKQVEPGSPEPAPAHLRFFVHSLILESSELIYVKLQNVLTPYDIETICGGLFN